MADIYHGTRALVGGEDYPEEAVNRIRDAFAFATSKLPALDGSGGLNEDLVSLWRMDMPSGPRIDWVGPNHLKENGGTIAQAAGKIGFAALLASASSQWLSVPDNPSLTFTSAFSLSIWVKYTTLATNQVIAAKWTYQTQGSWAIQSDPTNSDELRVYIATSLIDDGSGGAGVTTAANLAAGTWYHLAVIYDGSLTGNANRLKVYVNSVAQTLSFVGTIPATLQNSTADLNFGKWGGSLTRYLNGALDAGRLYNRAITSAEVGLLYNSGTGIE